MFCSACGNEVQGELNYCNRCGGSLNASSNLPAAPIEQMSFTKLVLIMGAILIFGMIVVFTGVGELLRKGVAEPAVVLLALAGLAAIFSISAMLIRLWLKVSGINSQPQRRPQTPPQQNFNPQPRAAQLPPRPANFGSVTDHTTRTFDPVYRDAMEAEGKK